MFRNAAQRQVFGQGADVGSIVEREAVRRERQFGHKVFFAEIQAQPPAVFQHAAEFGQHEGRVVPKIDGVYRHGFVERGIGKGQRAAVIQPVIRLPCGDKRCVERLRLLVHQRRNFQAGVVQAVRLRQDVAQKAAVAATGFQYVVAVLQAGGGERADDLGQVAQVHRLPERRACFVMRAA